MKPEEKKDRKSRGLELRKTHYNLGHDQWNYLSQYHHDYPPYPFTNQYLPQQDNVSLRKTNFKLGDNATQYSTTAAEQSKELVEKGSIPSKLDEAVKNDLRRHHFNFGNAPPDFQTVNQLEFYDKTKFNVNGNNPNNSQKARATNYILGNDVPDYVSEAKDRFRKPNIDFSMPRQNISTADLQKNHYAFGNDPNVWSTTQNSSYVPQYIDNKKYTKNLTKTNFILGDDKPAMTSFNQDVYVKHPICANGINQEFAKDLRNHHFNFGNENYPDQLRTINHQDYLNPASLPNENDLKAMDPKALRYSHFKLGDDTKDPDHYSTTYNIAHSPKKREENQPKPNATFKSSVNINCGDVPDYQTENSSNFVPNMNKTDPKYFAQVKNIVNDIKSSHFNFGDMKNDFSTTTGNAFKFDPNAAKAAKGALEKELIHDLQATHYKLGYGDQTGNTTHFDAYTPLNIDFKATKDPNLQQSHFGLNCNDTTGFKGQTIYQSDFIKKPLPKEEDYYY